MNPKKIMLLLTFILTLMILAYLIVVKNYEIGTNLPEVYSKSVTISSHDLDKVFASKVGSYEIYKDTHTYVVNNTDLSIKVSMELFWDAYTKAFYAKTKFHGFEEDSKLSTRAGKEYYFGTKVLDGKVVTPLESDFVYNNSRLFWFNDYEYEKLVFEYKLGSFSFDSKGDLQFVISRKLKKGEKVSLNSWQRIFFSVF